MKLNKIFEVGAMLGLKPKDIKNLLLDKTIQDTRDDLEVPSSPVDIYPKGTEYGTISINDFK